MQFKSLLPALAALLLPEVVLALPSEPGMAAMRLRLPLLVEGAGSWMGRRASDKICPNVSDFQCGPSITDGCCPTGTICGIYAGNPGCCPIGQVCDHISGTCGTTGVVCGQGCCAGGSTCVKNPSDSYCVLDGMTIEPSTFGATLVSTEVTTDKVTTDKVTTDTVTTTETSISSTKVEISSKETTTVESTISDTSSPTKSTISTITLTPTTSIHTTTSRNTTGVQSSTTSATGGAALASADVMGVMVGMVGGFVLLW